MTDQKIEEGNTAKRYVIISDTHFGEKKAILSKEGEAQDFFDELEEKKYDAVNELILLGDIFDFGPATGKEAISKSETFFVSLEKFKKDQKEKYNIDMKVILMVGNHDHYIISKCRGYTFFFKPKIYNSQLLFSREQFSEVFNNIFGSSPETERLKEVIDEIRYPEYVIQLNKSKKRILLRHGHHADKYQTGLALPGTIWRKLATGKYVEKDFEKAMMSYYPIFFFPRFKYFRRFLGVCWRIKLYLCFLCSIRNKIKNNRWISSREEVKEGIDLLDRYNKLLDENNKVKFDYFIFGHTHNACFCDYRMTDLDFKKEVEERGKKQDYYEFNIGIINSGGWIDYKHDFETTKNYIVIDEDQIMLCSVGRPKPIKRVILNKS